MTKHSPSPWKILQTEKYIWIDAPCRQVTSAKEKVCSIDDEIDLVDHANFRLISAAPELLAALENLVKQSESAMPLNAGHSPYFKAMQDACKAIDKANGTYLGKKIPTRDTDIT